MPEEDWRLGREEPWMYGAELERRPFTAPTADWDHEHCIFCTDTFLEPPFEGLHEGLVHGYDRSREPAPVEDRTTVFESGGRMVESPIEEQWICDLLRRLRGAVRLDGRRPEVDRRSPACPGESHVARGRV